MTDRGEQEDTSVQAVVELYEAIRDCRVSDVLALVDPEVICLPLVRPGLSVYHGHGGMARLVTDMHAAHGRYQVEVVAVDVRAEQVTAQARILPEPGYGPPLPVHSVFAFRDGRIVRIESFEPGQEAAPRRC